jgi:hypothetical protein
MLREGENIDLLLKFLRTDILEIKQMLIKGHQVL